MDPRSQFGKEPDLPFWAQGVKQQDYDNLLNAVRTYFRDHRNELEINEEKGVVTPTSGPLIGQPLGLHNLIRVVPGMNAEDVQRHVFGHFGKVMVIKVEQQRLEGATFDEVKKHIRLRLLYTDPTNPADAHKGFPGIQLSETLRACPMLDLEHSAMSVSKGKFESWNVSIEDLNQLALDQTFADINRNGDFQKFDFSNGQPAFLASDDYIYFASICLDMNRVSVAQPRCGYLIFVTGRQSLLVQPLTDPSSVKNLGKLAEAAHRMFQDAVGKVGTDAYWVKDGAFKRLELGDPGSNHPNIAAMSKCIANPDN